MKNKTSLIDRLRCFRKKSSVWVVNSRGVERYPTVFHRNILLLLLSIVFYEKNSDRRWKWYFLLIFDNIVFKK